ncbi:hypothetical protein GCM10009133_18990 [Cocleimonas flava]
MVKVITKVEMANTSANDTQSKSLLFLAPNIKINENRIDRGVPKNMTPNQPLRILALIEIIAVAALLSPIRSRLCMMVKDQV